MLRRILVPLDGSRFAEEALPVAFRLARRHDAPVELVSVYEPPLPIVRTGGAPVRDPAFDQERRREAQSYVEALLGRIDAEDRARAGTIFLEGPVTETLLRRIGESAADLVVMTTHARGGLSRAWLGSVADGLVRRASVPVLLVRPAEGGGAPGGERPFRQVLIPLDGSPAGELIIDRAVDVAGTDGVEYTLLRVLAAGESRVRAALPGRGETPSTRTQRATVEALLETKADILRGRGVTVRTQTAVEDSAARGILEYAMRTDADLIAMTTHSRGGLERLVLGSVADKVLRSAERPLLLLNPGADAA